MGIRGSFRTKFSSPSDVGAVSAWLRVASATSDVNGISSLPDMLNNNPAVQSVDARKPVIENSANGLPCMRFATNDVLSWPITLQSSANDYAGWGCWVKIDAASGTQRIFRCSTGTLGASGNKLNLSTAGATVSSSASPASAPGTFRNNITGAVTNNSWHFYTIEWDKDGASNIEEYTLTLDGVNLTNSSTLSPTTKMGSLSPVTGNILIGNTNNGVASSPLNGLIGPNIYAFGRKMANVNCGVLTSAARAFLMNYERPT